MEHSAWSSAFRTEVSLEKASSTRLSPNCVKVLKQGSLPLLLLYKNSTATFKDLLSQSIVVYAKKKIYPAEVGQSCCPVVFEWFGLIEVWQGFLIHCSMLPVEIKCGSFCAFLQFKSDTGVKLLCWMLWVNETPLPRGRLILCKNLSR